MKYLLAVIIVTFASMSLAETIIVKNMNSNKMNWDAVKIGAYDDAKKELTFTANNSGSKETWRLVHDSKNVIAFFESGGTTASLYTIFESDKQSDCQKEIDKLGLSGSTEGDLK